MKLLDLTLPAAAENVALDEALLEQAESDPQFPEVLRLWEPHAPIVVVGRSSQVAREVYQAACVDWGIPILRRASGGAAIVTGPGCLMYAVVLDLERRPHLRAIDEAHRFVLGKIAAALSGLITNVSRQGTSDLAWGDRKCSGNSLRIMRRRALYHGTLLYNFDLKLVGELLRSPPRQPAYRQSRGHDRFIVNLPLTSSQLREALITAWRAETPPTEWPREVTAQLVQEKYSQAAWNLRH